MKKNSHLNKWLWKWHFIAGLISLPFVLILSVTGTTYLFKEAYEKPIYQAVKQVVANENPISYQRQWEIATLNASKKPNSMVLPASKNETTQFISGRFGNKSSVFVDPYQGNVSGEIVPKDSFMLKIRKLHGELLLGKYGAKVVELIASWMIVLIITGLVIWYPIKNWSLKGFFIIRTGEGKRTFFRDLHAVTGFWISIMLLLTLGGGLPWTDVFGNNFKWLQQVTNTGYPATWDAQNLQSEIKKAPLTLDEVVIITKDLQLPGKVVIGFPMGKSGVFTISNVSSNLDTQKMYHFDQYTGKQLIKHDWEDVGILMRARMWLMAFHQGEFGPWNWWLMLFMAIALTVMSIAAILSYLLRKRKNSWGVPKVHSKFKVGSGFVALLIFLSIVFPLFGASCVLILIFESAKNKITFAKDR